MGVANAPLWITVVSAVPEFLVSRGSTPVQYMLVYIQWATRNM